jgi:hypothetical protein
MESRTITLGKQCSIVVLEVRVVPLSLPVSTFHRAMEVYAASLRCMRSWAVVSFVSTTRQGECTVWIIGSRKEQLRRLDNTWLGWKRALERMIHGASLQRREWSKVQGASQTTKVYAEVHAPDDDEFEAAKTKLLQIARKDAPSAGAVNVSGPFHPLPAPS